MVFSPLNGAEPNVSSLKRILNVQGIQFREEIGGVCL